MAYNVKQIEEVAAMIVAAKEIGAEESLTGTGYEVSRRVSGLYEAVVPAEVRDAVKKLEAVGGIENLIKEFF